MPKSIRDIPKKRGRPKTTGRGEGILIRLHSPQLAALDNWISQQDGAPSRPEAIRRILGEALARPTGGKPISKRKAEEASVLASRAVEHVVDKSVPVQEQQRRKRAL